MYLLLQNDVFPVIPYLIQNPGQQTYFRLLNFN